jgi:hypothetical protein
MASAEQQLDKVINSWGLTRKDIKEVKYLDSFHEVQYRIIQRLDTKQYIQVSKENSWRSGVDDHFHWRYLHEDEIIKHNLER